MTSTTTTTTTTNAAASAAERLTYWCHECDMSVSLLSSTTPLLCPYCNSDFLEEMDSPLFTPNPNPNPEPNPNPNNFPPFASFLDPTDSTTFQLPSVTPADDNFLLDSPYLHRLITHLTNSESDGSSPSITTSRYHSPASKSAIEAIHTIKITNTFLELDPIILCAVCKDQFIVDDETKQLP